MPDSHKNFAYSTVATAPSPPSSGTSLVVAAGEGTLFPTGSFNATIWPVGVQPTTANAEVVRCTVSTDTFTITRAQEGSAARTVVVGDQIAATVTAKTLTDVEGMPLGLTGATAATRYVGGTAAGAPASGTFAIGDYVVGQDGAFWACITAGTPGTWLGFRPDSGVTFRTTVPLDTPDGTGNGYPALTTSNGFTNVRRVVPAFTKDVVGTWEGACVVPANYGSAGAIVVSYVANATSGVFRSRVGTAVVAVSASEDTAYTNETYADTTVPGTAKQRFDVSFTLTSTPIANSTLNVKVEHEGTHANDTLAVDCLIWACHFQYLSI